MSLIKDIGQIVADLASPVLGYLSNQQTNQSNQQIQNDINQQNKELYFHNLEYNSPKSQMERLEQAGLNPQLVYGGNSHVVNTSSNTPKMEAAKLSPFTDFSNLHGLAKTIAEINNIEANTNQIKEDTNLKTLEAVNKQIQNSSLQFDYDLKNELREVNKEITQETLNGIKYDNQLKQLQQELNQKQIKSLQSQILLNDAQLTEQQARNALWKAGVNPNNSSFDNLLKMLMTEPQQLLNMFGRILQTSGQATSLIMSTFLNEGMQIYNKLKH